MRSFAVLLCMLCSGFISAQEFPKAEVFGGYSYLHIDTQGITGSKLDAICNSLESGLCPPGTFAVHPGFNGWNASAQFNFNRSFGVKGDFSGHYGTPVTAGPSIQLPRINSYSFLFGPVFSAREDRFTVFAHALFGSNRIATNLDSIVQIPGLTVSDSALAMAFGGGLDLKVGRAISVRLAQADYLYTKHDFSLGFPGVADHQNNLRFSAGVVFRFGGVAATPSAATPTPVSKSAIAIPALGIMVTSWRGGGAEIVKVDSVGIAASSGLRMSDVINSIDGKRVDTPADLLGLLSGSEVGAYVRIGFMIRGQWQSEKSVTLAGK